MHFRDPAGARTQDPSAKRNALPAVNKADNKRFGFSAFDEHFPFEGFFSGFKLLRIDNNPGDSRIGEFPFFSVVLRNATIKVVS
jgi:hypothetical protein